MREGIFNAGEGILNAGEDPQCEGSIFNVVGDRQSRGGSSVRVRSPRGGECNLNARRISTAGWILK